MPATLPQPDESDRPPVRGPHSPRGPRSEASELTEVFGAFEVDPGTIRELGSGASPRGPRFRVVGPDEVLVGRRFVHLDEELGEDSPFLLVIDGQVDDRRLAMWRNALWPLVHVGAILRCKGGKATRITIGGKEKLDGDFGFEGVVLFGRRTSHVMSPDATVQKFDRNASGWDGEPGGPGYPHFRWMRRFVGTFIRPARATRSDGGPLRILDFGCGAGWVGIEAARAIQRSATGGLHLAAFDPSPEMVKIAAKNASSQGIDDFDGRVGFGERPPFGGDRSAPYDLVLSSGVVSFSPDVEAWLDGLVATLDADAELVVGDIHPSSRGFQRRRQRKPLLPVREMNARTREEVRAGLEARGLDHVESAAYQLTRPIPELMHLNETLLKGLMTYPLLWLNQLMTRLDRSFGSPLQDRFDSWVMHFRRPE